MEEPVKTAFRDGVATVTLNRPEAYNAITVELSQSLERAVRELAADDDTRVVVIRGAGQNFCVGGDFKQMDALRAQGADAVRELFLAFLAATEAITEIRVPVSAAIHGIACAGGFELGLASDIVLVSETARLADIHLRHGMIPGGGSTQRLPRMVGAQRALGLILTGDMLSAEEAVDWGIAYRAFPEASWEADVDAFAAALAEKDPAALAHAKRLVRDGLSRSLEQGLELELEAVLEHLSVAAEFAKGPA